MSDTPERHIGGGPTGMDAGHYAAGGDEYETSTDYVERGVAYGALEGDGEVLEEVGPDASGGFDDLREHGDDFAASGAPRGSFGDRAGDGDGFDATDEEVDNGEPGDGSGLEELLVEMLEVLERAKSMPLSTSVLVDRDELREYIEAALQMLPTELIEARELLSQRRQVLAQAKQDAYDLLEDTRAQAEQMVQRTEISRKAHRLARDVEERARLQARELRREADDYCDRRLAVLERALGKSLKTLREQREEMRRRLGEDETAGIPPDVPGGLGGPGGPGAALDESRGVSGPAQPGGMHLVRSEGDLAGLDPFDQDAPR